MLEQQKPRRKNAMQHTKTVTQNKNQAENHEKFCHHKALVVDSYKMTTTVSMVILGHYLLLLYFNTTTPTADVVRSRPEKLTHTHTPTYGCSQRCISSDVRASLVILKKL